MITPDINELVQREADLARNRENRGRQASVFANYRTTGQGIIEVEDRIDFGLIYTHKPSMAYGHEIDIEDVRIALAVAEDAPETIMGPIASCYVTEWDQDEKRNYVGAWVALSVYFPAPIPVDAAIPLRHHIQFTGIALKKVPVSMED